MTYVGRISFSLYVMIHMIYDILTFMFSHSPMRLVWRGWVYLVSPRWNSDQCQSHLCSSDLVRFFPSCYAILEHVWPHMIWTNKFFAWPHQHIYLTMGIWLVHILWPTRKLVGNLCIIWLLMLQFMMLIWAWRWRLCIYIGCWQGEIN